MCGYEITGMRKRIQAIQSGCIHTNECKGALCVAMGTRATLTKGEQKSKRHRHTGRRRKKKKRKQHGERKEKLARIRETKEEKKE